MPNYTRFGKILTPLSRQEFVRGMDKGHFVKRKHKGFIVLLYYTGVRCSEALRATEDQFTFEDRLIFFEVGNRLKSGRRTPPLAIPEYAPFVHELTWAIDHTRKRNRVWPYCRSTGFNIVSRVFHYPHHLRLSRITSFFGEAHRSIAEVQTWTGLTLGALNYYVGIVGIKEMAKELALPRPKQGKRLKAI